VDLSGYYANCKYIDLRGEKNVKMLTLEGQTITAGVDHIDGSRTDVDSVTEYVNRAVDQWMKSGIFHSLIRRSERFGCSVRPGCNRQVSISCFFSGKASGPAPAPAPQLIPYPIKNETRPTIRDNTCDHIRHYKGAGRRQFPLLELPTDLRGDRSVLAFTKEQYRVIESEIGGTWDRTHYLENLSGFETDCWMISKSGDWPLNKSLPKAHGKSLQGIFGSAPNEGSTLDAFCNIIMDLTKVYDGKKFGCSLIPDCIREPDKKMMVVMSCLCET